MGGRSAGWRRGGGHARRCRLRDYCEPSIAALRVAICGVPLSARELRHASVLAAAGGVRGRPMCVEGYERLTTRAARAGAAVAAEKQQHQQRRRQRSGRPPAAVLLRLTPAARSRGLLWGRCLGVCHSEDRVRRRGATRAAPEGGGESVWLPSCTTKQRRRPRRRLSACSARTTLPMPLLPLSMVNAQV